LLRGIPGAPIRVLVVWEPVLATDVAAPFGKVLGLISDGRAVQYWDAHHIVSADLVRSVNAAPARYGREETLPPEFIAWDVVAVFGPGARWETDVPVPAYYGGPVAGAIDDTRGAILRALERAAGSARRAPRS
jgi:hypothetical protein